eukprot:gnl/Spiro4/11385_TR6007_c1_g1_i1.p1 gnl/Spiro4/11385_TR6007_c1_g1~~gnl/Spiro4/11385_TR6007_c1_g1_i1.p1  ORF type:complete len:245 (-),score=95.72 gnl/Spiro4/11385_TR6007_c1_g1_i1:35-769(-)
MQQRMQRRMAEQQNRRFQQVRSVRALPVDRFQTLWDARFKYVEIVPVTPLEAISVPIREPPPPPTIAVNEEQLVREYQNKPLVVGEDDTLYDIFVDTGVEVPAASVAALPSAVVDTYEDEWAFDCDDSDGENDDDSNSERCSRNTYPSDEDDDDKAQRELSSDDDCVQRFVYGSYCDDEGYAEFDQSYPSDDSDDAEDNDQGHSHSSHSHHGIDRDPHHGAPPVQETISLRARVANTMMRTPGR